MNIKHRQFLLSFVTNAVIVLVVAVLLVAGLAGTGAVTTSGANNAVYRGNTAAPKAALMINVYWGTEYIEGILRVLDAYDAKATFFVGGSWADDNNKILCAIAEAGHELGNHGFHHKDHKNLTLEKNIEEIVVTEKLVHAVTGIRTRLFAPPSGSLGNNMFEACKQNEYTVIMWTRDTVDWRDKDEDLVYSRAINDLKNGDLILMHPTAHTLAALPRILDYFRERNIAATTVSDCLAPTQM